MDNDRQKGPLTRTPPHSPYPTTQAGFRRIGSQSAQYFPEEYRKMPLVNIVIALIIVGVALWLINRFIPMASSIKTILNIVVVVSVGVWVLQVTGLWGPISTYRVTR